MRNTVVVSSPVCGMLGIAFVVLKLCGVINWSWWWVLLPFYAPLVVAFIVVGLLVSLLVTTGKF